MLLPTIRRWLAVAIMGLLLVTMALPLTMSPKTAFAYQETISINPYQGPPGTKVTVTGAGWQPGWTVPIGTDLSPTPLVTATANSSGTFSISITIPSSAPVGQLRIWAIIGNGGSADAWFNVTSDTTAPSVSWTSPVGNGGTYSTSSGTVTLQASASDNVGVARVKFTRWDAVNLKVVVIATVTASPWRSSIAVSSLNNGYNQLNVQAWDAAGNASASPYIWINRVAAPSARLSVPFATQMGSAGDPNSGSNNCGPASITMAILYYGGSTTVADSAIAIRGYNNSSNGPTDFKSASTISWLAKFSLAEKDVSTFDQVKQEISVGRPVVILVNNNAYRYLSPPPYPNDNNGWFTTSHIVVVTGYDSTNVYVNDPLRSTADYAIPVATFQNAASTANGTSTTNWYAASIYKP